ncbi:DeoR family transcriptional regulator [Halogeometricum luteum]|uniref:HTH domain-containing protein n=1 Tax=Halogeometricum luteum TaxID=2950537 RepID=A0ABU2G3H2_9EURY|nr:HTH domain-containing protein [Halogeometricum sp. S3BR5-2]MDS0295335.1 HTH domain-containing protein [Halogeometricum sp. S3BR5-2]
MSRERGDAGRYTETITLDDVLGVFEAVEGPVVTSGDVAEALDCSRETARRKLRTLEEQGHVASRKTAGRVVWWVVDEQKTPHGVNPDDPFWDFAPGISGESDVSERIDAVLYGEKST